MHVRLRQSYNEFSTVHKDITQRLIRKQRSAPKQTLSVRLRFGVYKNCMFLKNKIIQCKIDRKHPRVARIQVV